MPGDDPILRGEPRRERLAASGRLPRSFARVIALIAKPNPSYDYYLASRLRRLSGLEVVILELRSPPAAQSSAIFEDSLVLFCRYATRPWLAAVERNRSSIAGVALFLDDDLEAMVHDPAIPLYSRLRIYWQGVRHWPRLGKSLNLLFVSTPALAERFAAASPWVLPPLADVADTLGEAQSTGPVKVAFHATSLHRAEHLWLMAVAVGVMKAAPEIEFEVVASGVVAMLWRVRTGVRVLAPLPWPEYRRATAAGKIDLMLAPLLPSRANSVRAWTKRIDAARAGAALLVSDAEIYRVSDEEGALGMSVDLDPMAWTDAIIRMIHDTERRRRLAMLNHEMIEAASARSEPLFEPSVGTGRWRMELSALSP